MNKLIESLELELVKVSDSVSSLDSGVAHRAKLNHMHELNIKINAMKELESEMNDLINKNNELYKAWEELFDENKKMFEVLSNINLSWEQYKEYLMNKYPSEKFKFTCPHHKKIDKLISDWKKKLVMK